MSFKMCSELTSQQALAGVKVLDEKEQTRNENQTFQNRLGAAIKN